MTHSKTGILLYALMGKDTFKFAVDIDHFEEILLYWKEECCEFRKIDHKGTMVVYYSGDIKEVLGVLGRATREFAQSLFNVGTLPDAIMDSREVTHGQLDKFLADKPDYPSFGWSFAGEGKMYGSEIYLT